MMIPAVLAHRRDAQLGWPEVTVSVVYEYEAPVQARGDNAPEDGGCTVLEVFVGGANWHDGGVDILGLLSDDQIKYLEQVCFEGHGK
jgi:hypothetical protein